MDEPLDSSIAASNFGSDFIWGVSAAAFQIEGASVKDGKGISIWDTFTSKKGAIYQNQNARISCDFYHRYKEDILLMKSMGLKHFRFSISWTRIQPHGVGSVNSEGIDFYNRVIDFCLKCGITPWLTLYHWDLPLALEKKGGWTNRSILEWFSEYTRVCAKSFGDRVKYWMVLNEPMVFTGAGYFMGVHAPGRKGIKNFLPAVHHAVMCQALGGKILREIIPDAEIGTTFSCSQVTPKTISQSDKKAAIRVDALLNRLFIEPTLGLGYPIEDLPIARRIKPYIRDGDMERCVFDFDFIGIQNYTREVVSHSYFIPYIQAKIIKASKRNVPITLMDWEVYPPSIFEMIKKYDAYPSVKKVIITENGAAFEDLLRNNEINDIKRKEYLEKYLRQVYKAKKQGANIQGYFVWTFTDNFEWAEGYYPRFGLVYVDFHTQKRILKRSGKWYSKFLQT